MHVSNPVWNVTIILEKIKLNDCHIPGWITSDPRLPPEKNHQVLKTPLIAFSRGAASILFFEKFFWNFFEKSKYFWPKFNTKINTKCDQNPVQNSADPIQVEMWQSFWKKLNYLIVTPDFQTGLLTCMDIKMFYNWCPNSFHTF